MAYFKSTEIRGAEIKRFAKRGDGKTKYEGFMNKGAFPFSNLTNK
jgi:hypothetical protein